MNGGDHLTMKQFKNLNDFSSLFEDINSKKITIDNILFGNGLGLSHPIDKVNEAFRFKAKKFMSDNLIRALTRKNIDSPEEFLQMAWNTIRKHIVKKYIHDILNNETIKIHYDLDYLLNHDEIYDISGFLQHFKSIFTVNYDPLTLFSIDPLVEKGRAYTDCLEMSGKDDSDSYDSSDIVIERLADKATRKIIYLHGAFHIGIRKSGIIKYYWKVPIDLEEIRDLFYSKDNRKPLLIFEAWSELKEEIISNDPFLKEAHKLLEKAKGNLLVFGMSFKNDSHILERLEGSKIDQIYMTFFCATEYIRFMKSLDDDKYETLRYRIEPYKITDLSKNILWSRRKLHHQDIGT